MNINYTARHATITPEIKKHCERRLRAIEKLLGYPVEADLILSVEKYRHKAEINVKIKGPRSTQWKKRMICSVPWDWPLTISRRE